jgi:pentatricopeptide repeat protein
LVVDVDGRRIDALLPGRQGRILFAYLVLQRHRIVGRDELAEALWPHDPPQTAERGLNPLISKLRKSLGPASLEGRSSLRLRLPDDAWVDVEAAEQGAHRAESRLALGQWAAAWGPALVALFVSERMFLPGETAVWIDDRRAILAALRLRALEAYAAAALGLGSTELPAAVRAGRELVRLVPLRESGYQILMKALARQGNVAEGLTVYADLSRVLRDELGVSPSATTQQVYDELLHA